jgi:hypothetical protein
MNWLYDAGERRPTQKAAIAVGIAAAIGLPYALLAWQSESDITSLPGAVAMLIWLVVFVGYRVTQMWDSHNHGPLADYCHYGTVSKAQFEGCMRHADRENISRLNTNAARFDAARFARRDLEECLADSGPMCEDALQYRLLQDQAPSDPYSP